MGNKADFDMWRGYKSRGGYMAKNPYKIPYTPVYTPVYIPHIYGLPPLFIRGYSI